jgi:uncharacterized repeat protein (TIGR01451 family)
MKGKKRMLVIGIVVFLLLLLVTLPASAWGTSTAVAAVDDFGGSSPNYVYSTQMRYLFYSYFTTPMTTVEPGDVNAATLASYDTLLLFACNPTVFSVSQKADIVAFVEGGGKLVIWDSEEPGAGNSWDYSWLPTPFSSSCPGATGAFTGVLNILEENTLSSSVGASPYYIDTNKLVTQTDAVGDSNVFVSYLPSDWCVDMEATNVLNQIGPNHVYTKHAGDGIIIYCGLDWDYSGTTAGADLIKIIQQEFDTSTLPCSASPEPSLTVTKVADKSVYDVGDTVTFTITVTNPGTFTADDVQLVDYPPAEVSLSQTTYDLGDIAGGQSVFQDIIGTADTEGCNVKNDVIATGFYNGVAFFSGGDSATFDIGTNCDGTPVPEFPTIAMPVTMMLGILFVVVMVQRRKE